MSITVNFFDANENLTSFIANEGETFQDVLNHQDVQDWFEAADKEYGDEIEDYIVEIDGADVEDNSTIINIMLRATVQDGSSITFDFIANTEEDEDLNEAINREGGAAASGASGVVIVSISGGLQTARIDITNGVTTLRDVIFNDTVRARSGMTDAQLREATVLYQGQLKSGAELDCVRVNDADIVELSPRVASTKG